MTERFKVSYSSLTNYAYCPQYFKLVHIDKLKPSGNSPDTIFGELIHRYCGTILQEQEKPKEAAEKFVKIWNRFCSLYKIQDKKYTSLDKVGENILLYIKGFMKKSFTKFTVKSVEYKIVLDLNDENHSFKGYIDLIIELPNGRTVIIDFKTSRSLYNFEKYQDSVKDYQIVLYKKFYSQQMNIALKDIDIYFVVFEKDIESKKPISLIPVGSTPTKLKNAENWLNDIVRAVDNKKFLKNYSSCLKFGEKYPCHFYDKCRNK